MLIKAMGAMMERLGPIGIHFVGAAPKTTPGRDQVEAVYQQMRRDFFVASPFVLHASIPGLLAGAWSLVRESLFTGEVDRGKKEIIAWAISRGNECPFCVDAHHAAVRAAEADDAALSAWAEASARSGPLPPAPFDAPSESEKAEILATVVAFHYLNRMVSVFLDPKMMPIPDVMDPVAARMAQFMMGGMIDKGRNNLPGESLSLLPEHDASLAWRPEWARPRAVIADALAGWSALAEAEAQARLDPGLVAAVGAGIEQGRSEALATSDLVSEAAPLGLALRAQAELALLAARSPSRIDRARIEPVKESGLDDKGLLTLVAWASSRAARQAALRAAQSFESAAS
ncbi:MAG: carboxymuconolactone decarboxylase family protein [Myxococcota bacterium]